MYLGIDLGTSGTKVILTNNRGEVLDCETVQLTIQRPKPLYSEQSPQQWWLACCTALDNLKQRQNFTNIKAIGLSGQMHGAVLIDKNDQVIRPAILWNDGRCQAQCEELESEVEQSRNITGNIVMPGFTAPKLKWIQQNEPENFRKIAKVLLPKDYLRLMLSGDYASDVSDSAGTLWLNTAKRQWDLRMLKACGLGLQHMPSLFEGNQITGYLKPELVEHWGMQANIPIVAGAGDNAAGAIGVGLIEPGQGMLSLGTSGVYFVVADEYSAHADSAVHSFCHALPNRWHLMSVLLSAASCLQWFADSVVGEDISDLLAALDRYELPQTTPYFLPYLSGERTPHNNPHATGAFFGLNHDTGKLSMLHALLEGVSFGFADGVDALHQSGTFATDITLIGGGTKSEYWRQMLADVLNLPLVYRDGGDVGPALGAARLAQLAVDENCDFASVCEAPKIVKTYLPNAQRVAHYKQRRPIFQQLYRSTQALKLAE